MKVHMPNLESLYVYISCMGVFQISEVWGEDSFFLDFLKTLAQMQTILTNSTAELHVVLFVKSVHVHVGIPVREYSYRLGHLKAVLDSPVVWS